MSEVAVHLFELTVVSYLALTSILSIAATAVALTKLRRIWAVRARSLKYWDVARDDTPGISVLLPVTNEAGAVLEAVERLAGLAYPRHEVIVINDGSTDRTMRVLSEALDLERIGDASIGAISTRPVKGVYQSKVWPGLYVVDKEHGGRADALNAGLNVAAYQLFCVVGVRSRLRYEALIVAAHRFELDPHLVVLGAPMTPMANGTIFGAMQQVAYARSKAVLEALRSKLQVFTNVSDDFGVFRWGAAMTVGGFMASRPGNADLAMRIRLQKRRVGEACHVRFHVDPIGETPAPSNIIEQASRWASEQRELAWLYSLRRGALFRRRQGRLGWVIVPTMLANLAAPVLEVAAALALVALAALGAVSWSFVTGAALVSVAFGVLHSLLALGLVGVIPPAVGAAARSRQLAAAVLTSLGWRQLETLVRACAALIPGPRLTPNDAPMQVRTRAQSEKDAVAGASR